jgi:hypothetical protein
MPQEAFQVIRLIRLICNTEYYLLYLLSRLSRRISSSKKRNSRWQAGP